MRTLLLDPGYGRYISKTHIKAHVDLWQLLQQTGPPFESLVINVWMCRWRLHGRVAGPHNNELLPRDFALERC